MPGHSKNDVKPENSPGHPSNHPHPISPASSTGSGADSTVSGDADNVISKASGSGSEHLVGRDRDRASGSDDAAQGGRPRTPENTGEETSQDEGKRRDDEEENKPSRNRRAASGDNAQTPGGQAAPAENSQHAGGQNTTDIDVQNSGAQTAPDVNAQNTGAPTTPDREAQNTAAQPPPMPDIDQRNADAVMTTQSTYLNGQATQKADTPEAQAARQTQLAADARDFAEQWRDSGHDSGFEDAQGNPVTGSSYYEGWAQGYEATAAENRAIAQQNQAEATRVAEQNAAGQAAVEKFNTAETNALAPVQSEGATADDYTHVADTYAQLQAEWKDKPANNFVQIPVGGSIQPANPAGYFERQERLFRRLASQAGDPEGGVTPGATSEVLYNRVTRGGEFVQDSQPTVSQYTADGRAGRVIAYQTADGRAAVGRGVFQPADPLYQGVTAGGELVQQSTPPGGTQYVDPEGRVVARRTNDGMVAISSGVFVPPDRQRGVDPREVPTATPEGVPFPSGAVQQDDRGIPIAGPQNVPFPDSAVQLDAFGMPIATAQPVSAPEAQRPTVDDRGMPIATPGAVQLPANAVQPASVQVDARGMPIATAQPVPAPVERRPGPNILEIGLNSYSPLGGLQAVQDYAATPAEMALPAVPLEDRAAFMREHRMSPAGDLVYQIKSPDHSPSWYAFPLAGLDVVGGVGTPLPFARVAQGGKLVVQGTVGATNRVLARGGTWGDLAEYVAKAQAVDDFSRVLRQSSSLSRIDAYDVASGRITHDRLTGSLITRGGEEFPNPRAPIQAGYHVYSDKDMPLAVAEDVAKVRPQSVLDLPEMSARTPYVLEGNSPARGGPGPDVGGGPGRTGGGGGTGPGGLPPGGGAATYRTQGGLLIHTSGEVIEEAPHPTSYAVNEGTRAYAVTPGGILVPANSPAATVVRTVEAPTVAPVTSPAVTTVTQSVEADMVKIAPQPVETTPRPGETTRTVTDVVPPMREQIQHRVAVATPLPTITPGTNRGPVAVRAHGVAPRAVPQQAAQPATQTATSVAPSTTTHTSVSVTPKAQVPEVVPHTVTVTNTAPAVQPATGATTPTSANGLGPIPADGMKPPVRPPRKKRDHETQRPKDEPQQESDAPAGDHPHVSRWETRTVHELDHRTDEHTSEVVDDTNVRTFQVVERGAESTSGKKWQANHLEVTSNKGKATAAAVRFRRQPAETDVVDTADTADKPSRRDRFRARVQQGGQATRAGVA